MAEQSRALIPGCVGRGIDDVVAVQGADRDEFHILDIQARQKLLKLFADLDEAFFAPAHEVHLIDRDDEMRDAQERGDATVAAALLDDAETGIHEDDREIGRGGARDHVARVLDMARRIRDDELAARRGEITIGDVDRDPLLPLGPKPVGEICQIDLPAAGDIGGALQRLDLILHQRFRVVKEAPDERRFAVVDRARSIEPKDIDVMMKRYRHDLEKVVVLGRS